MRNTGCGWAVEHSSSGTGHSLLEAARHAARGARPTVAVIVRLSRLPPPAQRPHHRRVAQAMLQDTARRHGGQVFSLGCGDLALVCQPGSAGTGRARATDEPATDEPGAGQPGSGQPGAGQPGAGEPRAGEPRAGEPGAGGPGAGGPGADEAGAGGPGADELGADELGADEPAALPALLGRLLGADTASLAPDQVVSFWPLPDAASALIDYARSQAAQLLPACVGSPAPPRRPATRVERLAEATEIPHVADLLHRRTAIVIGADSGGQLLPLFRELSFSIATLEGRAGPGRPVAEDPYLFRHLATRLDGRMLALVSAALGGLGPLDPCRIGAPPIHLNLSLETAGSAAFAALVDRIVGQGGTAPGVEISLFEAAADPALFTATAHHVLALGCELAIDGVTAAALGLVDLSVLPPALIKLDWAPNLPRLPAADMTRLDAALARLDLAHVLLNRAETELAVRWGLQRGIRRFQGAHVDAMLAVSRFAACAHSARCTSHQCRERHVAAGDAARRGCSDHDLLDGASPVPPPVPAPAPAPASKLSDAA